MQHHIQNLQQTTFKKGPWTKQECQLFIKALQHVGKQWARITEFVTTRSQTQIRSHGQKYFAKLQAQFESKEILGDEFQKIGGQVNLRQELLRSRLPQPGFYFYFRSYSVKPQPNTKSEQQNSEVCEPMNSNKPQCLLDKQEPISFIADETAQQIQSIPFSHITKNSNVQSFFNQLINQDSNWEMLMLGNFYSTFVERSNPEPIKGSFKISSKKNVCQQSFVCCDKTKQRKKTP